MYNNTSAMYKKPEIQSKETPPPKILRRLSGLTNIDFSSISKSFMSTPLVSKTNEVHNRIKPPEIVHLTPKVCQETQLFCDNVNATSGSFMTNNNKADKGQKIITVKLPDHSISEAPVTIDVSGIDWKSSPTYKSIWLVKEGKPSKKKRKIEWSEEDQAVIEKLYSTRKKFCPGLSSISTAGFETIRESSMEENGEEKMDIGNENLVTESDAHSVQIIDDNTLVDNTDIDNMIPQEKTKMKSTKENKIDIRKLESARKDCSTIVLDDTEEQVLDCRDETTLEDGEIIDELKGKSNNGPTLTLDQPNVKFTVTVPPDLFQFTAVPRLCKTKEAVQNLGVSTLYVPKGRKTPLYRLRPVVIDGSNVAFAYAKSKGSGGEFSCRGIQVVVEYFKRRGHDHIVAFVPEFRKRAGKSREGHLLEKLEREGYLAFTPSREVAGLCIASHDDRFILRYAAEHDGIVVTRDNFRDLYHVRKWKDTIEKKLLQPTFIRGLLMFPEDPMGRNGISLDDFLKF